MRNVTVAATQMACTWDREETLERAAGLVEEAAQKGANIVLLQELDRKSTRLNSSHRHTSRMPSSA